MSTKRKNVGFHSKDRFICKSSPGRGSPYYVLNDAGKGRALASPQKIQIPYL